MKLTQQDVDLMQIILSKNNPVMLKDISKKLILTNTQIRYATEKLNQYLLKRNMKPFILEKEIIDLPDKEIVRKDFNFFISHTTPDYFRYTKKQMEKFILLKLLISDEPIPVGYFVKTLFTSRTTVVNLLKKIEIECRDEKIDIVHIKRQGYHIIDYSYKRFSFFVNTLKKIVNIREIYSLYYKDNLYSKAGELVFFNIFELDLLFKSLKEAIKYATNEENVDDTTFLLLMILIYKYQELVITANKSPSLKKIKEITILRLEVENRSNEFDQQTYESKRLVRFINRRLNQTYNLSFEFSKEFGETLEQHIQRFIFRKKNDIEIKDLDINLFIKGYEVLFYSILDVIESFQNGILKNTSKSEVGLIAIHYMSELEKHSPVTKKKPRILIICAEGIAISTILKERLLKFVAPDVIHSIAVYEFDESYIDYYDLIITTVQLLEIKSEKVLFLENIFSKDVTHKIKMKLNIDGFNSQENSMNYFSEIMKAIQLEKNSIENLNHLEIQIFNILNENTLKKKQSQKNPYPKFVFDNSLLVYEQEHYLWKEAVKKSATGLLKKGSIKKSYIDKIIYNIEQYGLYMMVSPGIIIAHAGEEDGVEKSGLAINIFENAVKFSEDNSLPVQVIITIALNYKNSYSTIEKIIQWIINSESVITLSDKKNREKIIENVDSLLNYEEY